MPAANPNNGQYNAIMKTKLLRKLRNDANKELTVIKVFYGHRLTSPTITGVVFLFDPLKTYIPVKHPFGKDNEAMLLPSNGCYLDRVDPFTLTNKWWIEQVQKMKRTYILARVRKIKDGETYKETARQRKEQYIIDTINELSTL